ncbi:MAG TPA: hypothetical protein PKC98_04040, partial [Candidatus Melainabacteria bacterium]|nr:hypothetical protein [Candidatus Melainabacteria bacterium]
MQFSNLFDVLFLGDVVGRPGRDLEPRHVDAAAALRVD